MPQKPVEKSLQAQQVKPTATAMQYAEAFSGPLPAPEVLAKYDQVVPGAAKSLFDDFHKNSEHLRSVERVAVHGSVAKDSRAQWMAFILVGGMTLAGIVCAKFISVALGVAIVVTSMPVTIGAFLRRPVDK